MRMTFLNLLLFLLSLVYTSSPVFSQETADGSQRSYQLKNQFKQNETTLLTLDNTVKGSTKVGDNQLPINIDMDMQFAFTTVDVNESNDATIQIKINQMQMQDEMMGPEPLNLLEMMGAQDQVITVKVSPYGETLDSTDAASVSGVQVPGMGGLDQSNTMKMPWPQLPKEPVVIGATWNEQMDVPIMGLSQPIISYSTYTLENVDERNGEQIATIKKETFIHAENVTMDPKASGHDTGFMTIKVTFQEYSAQGTGNLEFNISKGRLESVTDSTQMVIDMGGETNVNQMAFPNEYRMTFTMSMDGKFTETQPEPAVPSTKPDDGN